MKKFKFLFILLLATSFFISLVNAYGEFDYFWDPGLYYGNEQDYWDDFESWFYQEDNFQSPLETEGYASLQGEGFDDFYNLFDTDAGVNVLTFGDSFYNSEATKSQPETGIFVSQNSPSESSSALVEIKTQNNLLGVSENVPYYLAQEVPQVQQEELPFYFGGDILSEDFSPYSFSPLIGENAIESNNLEDSPSFWNYDGEQFLISTSPQEAEGIDWGISSPDSYSWLVEDIENEMGIDTTQNKYEVSGQNIIQTLNDQIETARDSGDMGLVLDLTETKDLLAYSDATINAADLVLQGRYNEAGQEYTSFLKTLSSDSDYKLSIEAGQGIADVLDTKREDYMTKEGSLEFKGGMQETISDDEIFVTKKFDDLQFKTKFVLDSKGALSEVVEKWSPDNGKNWFVLNYIPQEGSIYNEIAEGLGDGTKDLIANLQNDGGSIEFLRSRAGEVKETAISPRTGEFSVSRSNDIDPRAVASEQLKALGDVINSASAVGILKTPEDNRVIGAALIQQLELQKFLGYDAGVKSVLTTIESFKGDIAQSDPDSAIVLGTYELNTYNSRGDYRSAFETRSSASSAEKADGNFIRAGLNTELIVLNEIAMASEVAKSRLQGGAYDLSSSLQYGNLYHVFETGPFNSLFTMITGGKFSEARINLAYTDMNQLTDEQIGFGILAGLNKLGMSVRRVINSDGDPRLGLTQIARYYNLPIGSLDPDEKARAIKIAGRLFSGLKEAGRNPDILNLASNRPEEGVFLFESGRTRFDEDLSLVEKNWKDTLLNIGTAEQVNSFFLPVSRITAGGKLISYEGTGGRLAEGAMKRLFGEEAARALGPYLTEGNVGPFTADWATTRFLNLLSKGGSGGSKVAGALTEIGTKAPFRSQIVESIVVQEVGNLIPGVGDALTMIVGSPVKGYSWVMRKGEKILVDDIGLSVAKQGSNIFFDSEGRIIPEIKVLNEERFNRFSKIGNAQEVEIGSGLFKLENLNGRNQFFYVDNGEASSMLERSFNLPTPPTEGVVDIRALALGKDSAAVIPVGSQAERNSLVQLRNLKQDPLQGSAVYLDEQGSRFIMPIVTSSDYIPKNRFVAALPMKAFEDKVEFLSSEILQNAPVRADDLVPLKSLGALKAEAQAPIFFRSFSDLISLKSVLGTQGELGKNVRAIQEAVSKGEDVNSNLVKSIVDNVVQILESERSPFRPSSRLLERGVDFVVEEEGKIIKFLPNDETYIGKIAKRMEGTYPEGQVLMSPSISPGSFSSLTEGAGGKPIINLGPTVFTHYSNVPSFLNTISNYEFTEMGVISRLSRGEGGYLGSHFKIGGGVSSMGFELTLGNARVIGKLQEISSLIDGLDGANALKSEGIFKAIKEKIEQINAELRDKRYETMSRITKDVLPDVESTTQVINYAVEHSDFAPVAGKFMVSKIPQSKSGALVFGGNIPAIKIWVEPLKKGEKKYLKVTLQKGGSSIELEIFDESLINSNSFNSNGKNLWERINNLISTTPEGIGKFQLYTFQETSKLVKASGDNPAEFVIVEDFVRIVESGKKQLNQINSRLEQQRLFDDILSKHLDEMSQIPASLDSAQALKSKFEVLEDFFNKNGMSENSLLRLSGQERDLLPLLETLEREDQLLRYPKTQSALTEQLGKIESGERKFSFGFSSESEYLGFGDGVNKLLSDNIPMLSGKDRQLFVWGEAVTGLQEGTVNTLFSNSPANIYKIIAGVDEATFNALKGKIMAGVGELKPYEISALEHGVIPGSVLQKAFPGFEDAFDSLSTEWRKYRGLPHLDLQIYSKGIIDDAFKDTPRMLLGKWDRKVIIGEPPRKVFIDFNGFDAERLETSLKGAKLTKYDIPPTSVTYTPPATADIKVSVNNLQEKDGDFLRFFATASVGEPQRLGKGAPFVKIIGKDSLGNPIIAPLTGEEIERKIADALKSDDLKIDSMTKSYTTSLGEKYSSVPGARAFHVYSETNNLVATLVEESQGLSSRVRLVRVEPFENPLKFNAEGFAENQVEGLYGKIVEGEYDFDGKIITPWKTEPPPKPKTIAVAYKPAEVSPAPTKITPLQVEELPLAVRTPPNEQPYSMLTPQEKVGILSAHDKALAPRAQPVSSLTFTDKYFAVTGVSQGDVRVISLQTLDDSVKSLVEAVAEGKIDTGNKLKIWELYKERCNAEGFNPTWQDFEDAYKKAREKLFDVKTFAKSIYDTKKPGELQVFLPRDAIFFDPAYGIFARANGIEPEVSLVYLSGSTLEAIEGENDYYSILQKLVVDVKAKSGSDTKEGFMRNYMEIFEQMLKDDATFARIVDKSTAHMRNMGIFRYDSVRFIDTGFTGTYPFFLEAVARHNGLIKTDSVLMLSRNIDFAMPRIREASGSEVRRNLHGDSVEGAQTGFLDNFGFWGQDGNPVLGLGTPQQLGDAFVAQIVVIDDAIKEFMKGEGIARENPFLFPSLNKIRQDGNPLWVIEKEITGEERMGQGAASLLVFRNTETGAKVVAKIANEHSLRADYAGFLALEEAGLPVPHASLVDYKIDVSNEKLLAGVPSEQAERLGELLNEFKGKTVLTTSYLEGFGKSGSYGSALPAVFEGEGYRDLARGFAVDALIFNYDRASYNFMFKDGDLFFLDNGAGLFSTGSGTFKRFPETVDREQLLRVFREPYTKQAGNNLYSSVFEINSRGDIVIKDMDNFRKIIEQVKAFRDGRINAIMDRAYSGITPEIAREQTAAYLAEAQKSLSREDSREAVEMFDYINKKYAGNYVEYLKDALKTRRDSLIQILEEDLKNQEIIKLGDLNAKIRGGTALTGAEQSTLKEYANFVQGRLLGLKPEQQNVYFDSLKALKSEGMLEPALSISRADGTLDVGARRVEDFSLGDVRGVSSSSSFGGQRTAYSPLYSEINEKTIKEMFTNQVGNGVFGSKAVVYKSLDGSYHVAFLSESEITHHKFAVNALVKRIEGASLGGAQLNDIITKADVFSTASHGTMSQYVPQIGDLIERVAGFEFQFDPCRRVITGIQQSSFITDIQQTLRVTRPVLPEAEQRRMIDEMLSRIDPQFLADDYKARQEVIGKLVISLNGLFVIAVFVNRKTKKISIFKQIFLHTRLSLQFFYKMPKLL